MSRQIVLMTGSSSGIGLATAVRLALDAEKRFVVIATVISLTEKADLEAAVGGALDKTVFIKELDITQDENINSVVTDVIKTYGRIDILLNIAGVPFAGASDRVTRKALDDIFGVNLIGTIRLTQAVLPHMKRVRTGRIVTMSSTTGKIGYPYSSIYSASKFGLEGYFEALAAEVKAYNIRVCLVEPTVIDTPMLSRSVKLIEQQLDELDDDDVNDIDRQQLTFFVKEAPYKPYMKAEDFATLLIARCICAESPPLRYLVCEDELKEAIGQAVADLTGETALAMHTFGKGV